MGKNRFAHKFSLSTEVARLRITLLNLGPRARAGQPPALAGNFPIFPGGDNHHANGGIPSRDILIGGRLRVLLRADLEAQKFKILASGLTDKRGVLPGPGGEDQRIQAPSDATMAPMWHCRM